MDKFTTNMKYLFLFLCLTFLTTSFGQNDFETRYFTFGQQSLPVIPRVEAEPSFSLSNGPKKISKLNSLKVTKENYWQPVDMASAVADNSRFIEYQLDLNRPAHKKSGLSVSFGAEETGSTSTTKNTVYEEQRGWYDIRPSNYTLGRYSPYTNYRPYYNRVSN